MARKSRRSRSKSSISPWMLLVGAAAIYLLWPKRAGAGSEEIISEPLLPADVPAASILPNTFTI